MPKLTLPGHAMLALEGKEERIDCSRITQHAVPAEIHAINEKTRKTPRTEEVWKYDDALKQSIKTVVTYIVDQNAKKKILQKKALKPDTYEVLKEELTFLHFQQALDQPLAKISSKKNYKRPDDSQYCEIETLEVPLKSRKESFVHYDGYSVPKVSYQYDYQNNVHEIEGLFEDKTIKYNHQYSDPVSWVHDDKKHQSSAVVQKYFVHEDGSENVGKPVAYPSIQPQPHKVLTSGQKKGKKTFDDYYEYTPYYESQKYQRPDGTLYGKEMKKIRTDKKYSRKEVRENRRIEVSRKKNHTFDKKNGFFGEVTSRKIGDKVFYQNQSRTKVILPSGTKNFTPWVNIGGRQGPVVENERWC